jgi:hypothetical protein
MTSSPAPPIRDSIPPSPPIRVSFPEAPLKVSSQSPPISLSSKGLPVILNFSSRLLRRYKLNLLSFSESASIL